MEDIQEMCGKNSMITVNVTPDGHGDTIRKVKGGDTKITKMFVLPEERSMSIEHFLERLRHNSLSNKMTSDSHELEILKIQDNQQKEAEELQEKVAESRIRDGIFYYSLQNDCLRKELPQLVPHVDHYFEELLLWAETVFGTGPPDAVNLWIGPSQAVSSIHKDYYENLFFVASGEKVFKLYPPCDSPFLPIEELCTSRFRQQEDHKWNVVTEENINSSNEPYKTPWIDMNKTSVYDTYRHPIIVHVKEGDILYLPSLWFHQVSQTCETVAINWWFDMQFDSPLYCYFDLLQNCRIQP
mmetsp:Transcript_13992/g.20667  ORF Transcript_13992/g.20667 Transcript_13992/m.20667 type:complete len:298 (-) Transcript_13992:429-1322(-)|eukprot:CAMPEP_0194199050 /NCGR_PEP_ID=MMETSP0156-20130528/214_1 /TAXON_ID=33649 /ORGANISM="Thalassionema nitzschioides, Strain L26-B" /LENGTH=297 /DNA_ID=CAMNT_0038923889 /DNA_START=208 /DNA_END=1101 /DNA_ORIENTATION=+